MRVYAVSLEFLLTIQILMFSVRLAGVYRNSLVYTILLGVVCSIEILAFLLPLAGVYRQSGIPNKNWISYLFGRICVGITSVRDSCQVLKFLCF